MGIILNNLTAEGRDGTLIIIRNDSELAMMTKETLIQQPKEKGLRVTAQRLPFDKREALP
jgi:hypothetical protein